MEDGALSVRFADQVEIRRARLTALRDQLAQRLGEGPRVIAAFRALLDKRRARADRLEGEIAQAAAKGEHRELHAERMTRLSRLRGLIERTRIEIEIRAAEVDDLPDQIARLDRDLARLDAPASEGADERRSPKKAAARPGKAGPPVFDRDGPTREQVAARGLDQAPTSVTPGRLGADVPDTLRKLHRAKKISDRELRAAVCYHQDYRFGTDRAKLIASYETAGGGGKGAGEIAEDKLAAFDRWRRAQASIPIEFRDVLDAVVLNGVTLEAAPGLGADYAGGATNRRAASGALLVCGLKRLSAFYGGRS